jgi:hypothetical protein
MLYGYYTKCYEVLWLLTPVASISKSASFLCRLCPSLSLGSLCALLYLCVLSPLCALLFFFALISLCYFKSLCSWLSLFSLSDLCSCSPLTLSSLCHLFVVFPFFWALYVLFSLSVLLSPVCSSPPSVLLSSFLCSFSFSLCSPSSLCSPLSLCSLPSLCSLSFSLCSFNLSVLFSLSL